MIWKGKQKITSIRRGQGISGRDNSTKAQDEKRWTGTPHSGVPTAYSKKGAAEVDGVRMCRTLSAMLKRLNFQNIGRHG